MRFDISFRKWLFEESTSKLQQFSTASLYVAISDIFSIIFPWLMMSVIGKDGLESCC